MSRTAISIAGLCKAYRLWPRPHDLLVEALTGRRRHAEFVALQDVSLDIAAGTVLGILGRNGAGKSTLLRIVAGTLDATAGSVRVDGRIAAILELGTGFHPEYSGRENVLLGGMCLGMSRAEVRAKLDEIIAFAELEEFIDRPLRTYSSGMQARLAFAVATAVDPDVLIIDEALSVGDARFQLKSFDRIRRFKAEGRTILFVSHSIQTVVAICDRAVLLERGRIIADGDPNEVGNLYHELLFGPAETGRQAAASGALAEPSGAGGAMPERGREMRYGIRSVEITEIAIVDRRGAPVRRLRSGESYEIHLEVAAHADTVPLHYGVLLRDTKGFEIFGWDTGSAGHAPAPGLAAGERRRHRLRFRCTLAGGTYFLTAALAREDGTKEDMRFDAVEIVVEPTPHLHSSSLVNLELTDIGSEPPRPDTRGTDTAMTPHDTATVRPGLPRKDRVPVRSAMTAAFVNTMQLGVMDYRYKGRPALKCPMDLAIYAELLQELRPRSIIEFGSHKGGSAVWLADQVAAFGLDAMIHSFDIQPPTDAPYPGVEFRFCDTARIRDSIDDAFMRALPRPLLLIDDASHIYGHVLNTMEFFHDHAVPGDYMVVEDGMISIAEAEDLHGYEGGPFQAIHTFLKEHPGLYEIDRARCDRFGLNVTWNPDGYIRRIA